MGSEIMSALFWSCWGVTLGAAGYHSIRTWREWRRDRQDPTPPRRVILQQGDLLVTISERAAQQIAAGVVTPSDSSRSLH